MASAFGFSTGDFIAATRLVVGIIKALNDSRGSSRQYLELTNELRSLEIGLVHIKTLDSKITDVAQRATLRLQVDECYKAIDGFLQKLEKYHVSLRLGGSTHVWKDALRKVQWRLCETEELASFRACISTHVQGIEMLLATIQT
jgi:hypothetical protein